MIALDHLVKCRHGCRVFHSTTISCTICGQTKRTGYIVGSQCPKMMHVYFKKLDCYINWGACDKCMEKLGVIYDSYPGILIATIPIFLDADFGKKALRKSLKDFKKRISHGLQRR